MSFIGGAGYPRDLEIFLSRRTDAPPLGPAGASLTNEDCTASAITRTAGKTWCYLTVQLRHAVARGRPRLWSSMAARISAARLGPPLCFDISFKQRKLK